MAEHGGQAGREVDDAQGTAPRGAIASCAVSSFCMMLGLALFNGPLHTEMEQVFAWSRAVSTCVEILAMALILLAARWRPRALRPLATSLAACVVAAVAYAVALGGVAASSAPAVIAGSTLEGVADAWATVMWLLACSRLGLRRAAPCIAGPGAIATVVSFPLNNSVPVVALGSVAFAGTAATCLLCVAPTRAFFARLVDLGVPAEQEVVQPRAFLPPSHAFFAYILAFNVAYGFALRSVDVSTLGIATVVNAVVLLAAMAYALALRDRVRVDPLFLAAYAIVVAGLALLLPHAAGTGAIAASLIVAGYMCVQLLVDFALCALAARSAVEAISAVCWGTIVGNAGITVGVWLWLLPDVIARIAPFGGGESALDADGLRGLVTIAILTALCAYVAATRRSFGFDETIAGVAPDAPAPQPRTSVQYVDRVEQRCRELVPDARLTAREADVLLLLARGYAPSRIQEELGIGYNTVKYHVRNVYAKLDVHSQQELIELVAG